MDARKRFKQIVKQADPTFKEQNYLTFSSFNQTAYNFGGGIVMGKLYGITADTGGTKTKYTKALMFQLFLAFVENKNPEFKIIWVADVF